MVPDTFTPKCSCRVRPLAPGPESEPFVDARQILREFSPMQQIAAMGLGAYELLERGVIKWEDAVTSGRVRPLYQIVARERLTVARMVEAGVAHAIAQEAFDMVNTPKHIAIDQERRRLFQNLLDAGLTDEQIVGAVARGVVDQAFGISRPGRSPDSDSASAEAAPPPSSAQTTIRHFEPMIQLRLAKGCSSE